MNTHKISAVARHDSIQSVTNLRLLILCISAMHYTMQNIMIQTVNYYLVTRRGTISRRKYINAY